MGVLGSSKGVPGLVDLEIVLEWILGMGLGTQGGGPGVVKVGFQVPNSQLSTGTGLATVN